jgi:hypothetical protein
MAINNLDMLGMMADEFALPDYVGQAGIDPMQALQLAQEPQGIDRLTALSRQLVESQKKQSEALAYASQVAAQRPESRLLNENQTLGQFFKTPDDAQRAFMVNAGLKLAMGDTTKNLSSRLAEALGQGVGAMQSERGAALKQEQAKAAAQLRSAQLEGQQTLQTFGLEKEIVQEQRLRQKTDPAPSKELKILNEIERLESTGDIVKANQLREAYKAETAQPPSALEEGMAGIVIDSVKDVKAKGKAALNVVSDLDTMSNALDRGISTGRGAQPFLAAKSFLGFLGLKTEGTSEQEVFNAISNRMALQLRNPDSGYGLPGSTSNQDLKFLQASVPGLQQTPEGNRLLINVLRRQAQNEIKAAKFGDQLIRENGGKPPIDYSSRVSDYLSNLTLVTPEERDQIMSLDRQFIQGEASFVPGAEEGVVDPLNVPINLSGSM